ncbi:hypothetical protein BJY17_000006 [Agromyces hippuratus]|uniref:Uncharacterized protein n=1 Tax=Agromyces hippuratus TaxID=286438 RepID=A0A852WMY1_9MICO|nr:hypothetical protein [Agromyces hippuratus]
MTLFLISREQTRLGPTVAPMTDRQFQSTECIQPAM